MRLSTIAHGTTTIDATSARGAHLHPDHGQASGMFLDHQLGQVNYTEFWNANDGSKPFQFGVSASMLFQVQIAGG